MAAVGCQGLNYSLSMSRSASASVTMAIPCASPLGLNLLGFEVAAFMHEGDDENLALAQVIEDAPGIGGYLAYLLVVELGDFAAAERCGLDAVGHGAESRVRRP